VPPSAYPPAFPGALASEAIPLKSRSATDRLLRADALRTLTGLPRSWLPFGAERWIPLSAGMRVKVLSDNEGSRPILHPFPFWAGYNGSGKPGKNDDGSCVGSIAYPCSALLGGILGRVPSYRLPSPRSHRRLSARPHGGSAFTSALEGWEFHPHESQVIQPAETDSTGCPLFPRVTQQLAVTRVTSERVTLPRFSLGQC
jgi:hypothetical protein